MQQCPCDTCPTAIKDTCTIQCIEFGRWTQEKRSLFKTTLGKIICNDCVEKDSCTRCCHCVIAYNPRRCGLCGKPVNIVTVAISEDECVSVQRKDGRSN